MQVALHGFVNELFPAQINLLLPHDKNQPNIHTGKELSGIPGTLLSVEAFCCEYIYSEKEGKKGLCLLYSLDPPYS